MTETYSICSISARSRFGIREGVMSLAVFAVSAVCAGDAVYDALASRQTVAVLVKEMAKRTVGANNKVLLDMPYYPEGTRMDAAGLAKCRMDFRYPADVKGFRTLVWLHSGGLTHGARHWVALADTNIAQVAVSYRLLGKEAKRGEDCIEDAAAAVAWALRNVASYGGDPKRVYVAGHSAGAYLSMMVGMDPRWLAKWGFKPTDLAGIVPISGQTTAHFNVRKFAGDADPQYQPKIDALSALRYAGKNLPPILSICGQPPWDWKARAEENRFLIASCKAFGHKNARYVELPYANHHRACSCGLPYLELFIRDALPQDMEAR